MIMRGLFGSRWSRPRVTADDAAARVVAVRLQRSRY